MMVGALALAACGSDNNTAATSSGSSSSGGQTTAAECGTGTLNAEGSSAQKNAIEQAISSYGEACPGATVNYNATGSGAGIKQFLADQVDFAGSDSALKTAANSDGIVEVDQAQKRCGSQAWNIPMVTGPLAVSYNVPGLDTLVLTPELTAKMMLGQITTWNDPAIAAANPTATLPATPISVFFRSDESGTTENFERYLAASAPGTFTDKTSKTWTGKAGEGRQQNAGVAEGIKSVEGGFGYLEWSYARDNNLGIAKIDNGAGPVELTGETVGTAVASAQPDGQGNDLRLKLDYATKTAGAYPIILVTYEIVCSKYADPATAANVKAFLTHFASADVQKGLEDIGYAPLPAAVQQKVAAAIAAIS
jgi:phosphate transport system substrate-binding protein